MGFKISFAHCDRHTAVARHRRLHDTGVPLAERGSDLAMPRHARRGNLDRRQVQIWLGQSLDDRG